MFSNKKNAQKYTKYSCDNCDFITYNKHDYTRHLQTKKHSINTNADDLTEKTEKNAFTCSCGKSYKDNSGLWRHKNKCTNIDITPELVIELIKDNKEMKQLIMAQTHTIQQQNTTINTLVTTNPIGNNNNNVNITNNSNNKAFNINFFLNETCKDAINISDFVSSIKVTLADLENTGRKGYVQGISNIILRNLQDLEHHQRPIHCNDQKREVIYIKDNNKWEKETDKKPILTKAIKVIANENIKQIKFWKDKYPDCTDYDSKQNNMYLKIVSNSMNGLTEEESLSNISKIISNVAKETIINKNI